MFFTAPTTDQPWTRGKVLFISLALRLTLVLYSNIHDYVFNVSFTDIDYHVFSDAAQHVANGGSPYDRATYRYTPVLAYILLPNVKWADFGKFLFCFFDIVVGYLCFAIMDHVNPPPKPKSRKDDKHASKGNDGDEIEDPHIAPVVFFWLASPWTAIISARGSSDSLVCAAVLLTLYFLQRKNWVMSAVCHGLLAVHLKIYPLIYLPSLFIYLSEMKNNSPFWDKVKSLACNVRGFAFIFTSLFSFVLIISLFTLTYGDTFLEEFLLYHIKRRDVRHNFSPYFLPLYLSQDDPSLSKLIGLLAFIPQVVSILYFAFKFYNDLPFCWFLTTFAFVALNKVCTSQYFVWYMVFLPLIADRFQMERRDVLKLIAYWAFGQGLWLLFAYFYEFQGLPVFEFIFIASQVFLLINCYIIRKLILMYNPQFKLNSKSE